MKHLLAAIALVRRLACAARAGRFGAGPGRRAAPRATQPPATANVVKLPAQNVITIDAGTGRVIQLSAGAASVFAADPKVAEVHPASATSLFIFGVAPGRTTIAALSAGGGPIAQYDVMVRPSRYGAAEAEAADRPRAAGRHRCMSRRCRTASPITGQVKTAADADRVMQIVRGYLPAGQTVDNRLSVASSLQVNLRVRIAEMSRNLIRQLGVNWEALGNIGTIGKFPVIPALTLNANKDLHRRRSPTRDNPLSLGGNFNALIDALPQDELVHILAQPNLTAISGEAASFLVGGEFPIPVAQQNNQVTIEFKQFGVSLAFVPTVASDGQITLKVRPEVSQLTNQSAVQLTAGTFDASQVPSLTVRRAETTVELGSGESFAIAGLLQDSANVTGNGVPILGDVPILGALFRSDKFQRNETELVIVVTPYIVRPVAEPTALRLPTDGWQPPTDLERILLLRQSARQTGGPSAASQAVAAHPRQCRIHRAMTEVPAMLRRQLLCIAAAGAGRLRRDRSVSPGRHVAAERRQRRQSARHGGLARPTWCEASRVQPATASRPPRPWIATGTTSCGRCPTAPSPRSCRSPAAADRKAASNAARRTASRNSRRSRHPPALTGRTSSPSSRMPRPRTCCATD